MQTPLSGKPSSADFQVCCVAGFQTRRLHDSRRSADLEVGDTAGLETCATKTGGRCLEQSSRLVTILTDSSAEGRRTILPLRQRRSVAVPGHIKARTATRFGQTDAGRLCHVAAPGDGRTPEVGGNFRAGRRKLPLPKSVWDGRPG